VESFITKLRPISALKWVNIFLKSKSANMGEGGVANLSAIFASIPNIKNYAPAPKKCITLIILLSFSEITLISSRVNCRTKGSILTSSRRKANTLN